MEELFADLSGGCYFSKLDLSNAYLQIPLSNASKERVLLTRIRVSFNITVFHLGSPAIFQRTMEKELPFIYIKNILVTGASAFAESGHCSGEAQETGLRVSRMKSFFLQSCIEYLGHIIDKDGLYPTGVKVTAIKQAPTPKNATVLRSFLGMISYYGKFLLNLADKLTPLYDLLCKNRKWTRST